jgi:hypothetical protein
VFGTRPTRRVVASRLPTVRDFRRDLNRKDGIYVDKELHAWKLVSGRGKIADRIVPKAGVVRSSRTL